MGLIIANSWRPRREQERFNSGTPVPNCGRDRLQPHPLSLIDVPPEYESKDSLVEDDALRKSIKKSGVQQSIVVIPDGERFTVVKGARRVRISQIVGLKKISQRW